jgi:hypothetical protein
VEPVAANLEGVSSVPLGSAAAGTRGDDDDSLAAEGEGGSADSPQVDVAGDELEEDWDTWD